MNSSCSVRSSPTQENALSFAVDPRPRPGVAQRADITLDCNKNGSASPFFSLHLDGRGHLLTTLKYTADQWRGNHLSCNHEGLFVKLRAAGIEGAALRWLVSFLADRHQMTRINGTMSTSAKLFAGVPQGAILSPLLFSIYMNDIPFTKSTNLFADDTSSFVTDSVPSLLESKLQERTDSLSIIMVCEVASDCKSNKICSDGFSFKEDAGRKNLHNS